MDNELMHFGVKGMKWGVRRNLKSSTTTKKPKQRIEPHEDYKKAHYRKNVKTMSDVELRSRINRLDMEKRYSQLSTENTSKGKQYFNKIMKAGTTVATLTTTALTVYNNLDKIQNIVNKK